MASNLDTVLAPACVLFVWVPIDSVDDAKWELAKFNHEYLGTQMRWEDHS